MDRNSIIGIVLITILFAVYFYLFNPAQQQPQQGSAPADTSQVSPVPGAVPGQVTTPEIVAEPDSVREKRQRDRFSDLYPVSMGKEETVTVKTDRLTVNINTKGGSIRAAYLNEFSTYDSLPVPAIADNPDNQLYFEFPFNNRAIRSYDLYFTPSVAQAEVHGDDSLVLTLQARIDDERLIEQIYTFHGNTYDLGYSIRMKGVKSAFGTAGFYDLQWKSHLPRTELALENMRQKTTVTYRAGNDVEKLKTNDDHQKEKLSSLGWVAYKSQFFTSVLIGEQPFRSANLSMYTSGGEQINRVMDSRLIVDAKPSDDFRNDFRFYFGPNEYYTLRSYRLDLEDQMDLGWTIIGWINKGTTYVFKFLERYVSNYGLIIIILAILIRLVILPFSLSSYVSMAKMRIINAAPEIKALDEKHKDDAQKLQMAKMGIYREMGVSMFGGCLPMLFSYPFLIALFFFFPQAVELRHQPFLWAADLSTYDSIATLPFKLPGYGDHVSLFTILMALSTFAYSYLQQKGQPVTPATEQMKMLVYIMPIFLLFFLNNYASGLSFYYFVSNILVIAQNSIIRLFIKDDVLLARMREVQKKGQASGKNTGGKSRLESWMDSQQKKQQEIMKLRQQGVNPNRRTKRNIK